MSVPLGSPNVTPWDRRQAVALLTAVQADDDAAVNDVLGEIAEAGRSSAVLFTMTSLASVNLRELAKVKATTPELLIQSIALGLRTLGL